MHDIGSLIDRAAGGDRDAARALVAGLWHDGRAAPEAREAIPALAVCAATAGAPVVLLLGMLAEADDEDVREAVAAEFEVLLALVPRAVDDAPLRSALAFLLAHFPAHRERIGTAIAPLDLMPDDRNRLERCLDPDALAAWLPSQGLTPRERAEIAVRETESLLAYAGAKAVDAIWGAT